MAAGKNVRSLIPLICGVPATGLKTHLDSFLDENCDKIHLKEITSFSLAFIKFSHV